MKYLLILILASCNPVSTVCEKQIDAVLYGAKSDTAWDTINFKAERVFGIKPCKDRRVGR